jgi:hypothetical protein
MVVVLSLSGVRARGAKWVWPSPHGGARFLATGHSDDATTTTQSVPASRDESHNILSQNASSLRGTDARSM